MAWLRYTGSASTLRSRPILKVLGRAMWRQVTGYHRRSLVETKPLGIMLRIPPGFQNSRG